MGWSSGIKGLDVDENKRVGPIIVMEDDVGRVRDGMSLHPLVDRALTSVSATLRRDTRGAKGRVKERNEGLDSGIMARRMESHAVRAADEMPVARASESVAQGLGAKGWVTVAQAVQRVMLPSPCVGGVRRRSRARATGKCRGFWKAKRGVSQASLEGMVSRRSHAKGPWAALPSRRRARPVAVVAGSFKRARKARDATTAEAAL